MIRWILCLAFVSGCASSPRAHDSALVLMTDFGTADGAVSAMKGVAFGVDSSLKVSDLTHAVPPYNIWEAAYRLEQTFAYWPVGTVFVTVVDPGVGTSRKSVIARAKSGHFFVGPDNGLLTLIADLVGIDEVREISEADHRRKGSEHSYTFHGRDVYVHAGAKLAAGKMAFEQVGPSRGTEVVRLAYARPERRGDDYSGMIPVLDPNFGNVWTNIPKALIGGTPKRFHVTILKGKRKVYEGEIPFADTFGAVPEGRPLAYYNSLMNLSFALNQASFAGRHRIGSGPDWTVRVRAR